MQKLFKQDYDSKTTTQSKLYIDSMANDMTPERKKSWPKINFLSGQKDSIKCINAQQMIDYLNKNLSDIVYQFNYFKDTNGVYNFSISIPLNLHKSDFEGVHKRSIIGIDFTNREYIVYYSEILPSGRYQVKKIYRVKSHNLDIRANHASDVESCTLIQ